MFVFFFHSKILNQRHVSMKSYGPTGMLGSAMVHEKSAASSPQKCRNLGVSWDRWHLPIVPALQCFFFLIIFIDDLGLQKFTINPQRHGSPSRGTWSLIAPKITGKCSPMTSSSYRNHLICSAYSTHSGRGTVFFSCDVAMSRTCRRILYPIKRGSWKFPIARWCFPIWLWINTYTYHF